MKRMKKDFAWMIKGRRLMAAVLAFVLSLGLLSGAAFAAEDQSGGSTFSLENELGSETSGGGSGSWDADPASGDAAGGSTSGEETTPAPAAKTLAWKDLKVSQKNDKPATGNWYILETSTGTISGGGSADNVLYFVIYYTTTDGMHRTEVLLPGEDAISTSYRLAMDAGDNLTGRQSQVQRLFGVTNDTILEKKALSSVSTDQFLFDAHGKVQTIDKIQVFGKKTEKQSDWVCQGMRVYRVDELYGMDMYGWYSNLGFIDFKGEVIAEAVMANGAGIFRWNNSGGMFNLCRMNDPNGTRSITIVNLEEKSTYETIYKATTHVGLKVESAEDHKIVMRIDLADAGLAGFESLAGSYEAGSHSKVGGLGMTEVATLSIRYIDTFGDYRDVNLPFVINSLGQVVEVLGDVEIAGYGQQGDQVALPLMLPAYAEIDRISMVIGTMKSVDLCKIGVGFTDGVQHSRVRKSETDDIRYTHFAVYEDADVKVALDDATIVYSFTPGKENPVQYVTSTSIDGYQVKAGDNAFFYLQSYQDKIVTKPIDRSEKYLITLTTDNIANAGTTDDLYIQFKYISIKDKSLTSQEYSVKDYVRQFYGEWPGNVSDFAYKYGLRQGGTVQFIIPLSGVKSFESVGFRLAGEDEWQISGFNVALVESYDSRIGHWEEIQSTERDPGNSGKAKYLSHLKYTRQVKTKPVCFQNGVVPADINQDSYAPTSVDDEKWVPGTLIQEDEETTYFDGEGHAVDEKIDVDWATYRYYMTFADTQQDLGFTKERCIYDVTVHVAGQKVTDKEFVDEDCGSKNLFYFQLIFEHGKSGCTLANQQIAGDAFRTGADVTFKIPTSQDYGEVLAIQVIPDNQDSNGDIYDKLKIDYIDVQKETTNYLAPTWSARSNDKDGLGWVGIDYRDPAEVTTYTGALGHTTSEIASTFYITESKYSATFQVCITTGDYGTSNVRNEDGVPVPVQDDQFAGGLTMSYNYFTTEGRIQAADPFDVINRMAEYAGRTASKTRTYLDDGKSVTEDVDYYVSDPEYNFRAGKTDTFYITVNDISEFVDMRMQIKSSVVTKWNISSVKIYQLRGTGIRYLNSNGEYAYRFKAGEEPVLITEWDRAENLIKDVQIYRTAQKNSIAEVNFSMRPNTITLSEEASKWTSTVTPVPTSSNDVVNLFLYPAVTETSSRTDDYALSAGVQFVDSITQRVLQTSVGSMQRATDANGNTVFYALGADVGGMESIYGVNVATISRRTVEVPIAYGILQRLRGGVLIETYRLGGLYDAAIGGLMTISNSVEKNSVQRVIIQTNDSTPLQDLHSANNESDTNAVSDLAVALYFKTDDPSGQEIRSRYLYLSEQGYATIGPNSMYELDFNLGNVSEITGINVVSLGRMSATIDNVIAANQAADETITNQWSTTTDIAANQRPTRVEFGQPVQFVRVKFDTAEDEVGVSSGTEDPVRMRIGYYDVYGAAQTYVLDDVRPYIVSGNGFVSGTSDIVELLIPDFQAIRWIEVEPWHEVMAGYEGEAIPATLRLKSVTATVGLDGRDVSRIINRLIVQGTPLHVGLADVLMLATYNILRPAVDGEDAPDLEILEIASGSKANLTMKSGESMQVVPRVYGSSDGFDVKIELVDTATDTAQATKLDYTHGYTRTGLTTLISEAEAAENEPLTPEVAEAAQVFKLVVLKMLESYGDLLVTDSSSLFVPPRNYTGRDITYRLTVFTNEMDDVNFYIDIKVEPEEDPLPAAIEEFHAAIKAAEDQIAAEEEAKRIAEEEAKRAAEEAARAAEEAAKREAEGTSSGEGSEGSASGAEGSTDQSEGTPASGGSDATGGGGSGSWDDTDVPEVTGIDGVPVDTQNNTTSGGSENDG